MSAARWTAAAATIVILAALLAEDRTQDPVVAASDGSPRAMDTSMADPAEPMGKAPVTRVVQPSSSAPEVRRKSADFADRLPAEGGLLAGHELHADRVGAALSGDAFDRLLDAMDGDLRRNSDARALTDAYADAIAMQVADGELLLDRIACGLRLCVIRLVGPDAPGAWAAWSERFDNDSATPSYARIERDVELDSGLRERRFVFTTDPSSASLTVSMD